jgi:hypothetical protein
MALGQARQRWEGAARLGRNGEAGRMRHWEWTAGAGAALGAKASALLPASQRRRPSAGGLREGPWLPAQAGLGGRGPALEQPRGGVATKW